jgi:hypothetical protein
LIEGDFSGAVGETLTSASSTTHVFLSGEDIDATATGDWSAGFGRTHSIEAPYTFAAGRGHVLADDGGAAVGLFSEYVTSLSNDAIFQVGVGTSSGSRKSGLTVYKNGIVEMKYLPTYANDAAAGSGGLTQGQLYMTTTTLAIVAKS